MLQHTAASRSTSCRAGMSSKLQPPLPFLDSVFWNSMILTATSRPHQRPVRAGQGRAGQGRAGQGRAGQGRAGSGVFWNSIILTATSWPHQRPVRGGQAVQLGSYAHVASITRLICSCCIQRKAPMLMLHPSQGSYAHVVFIPRLLCSCSIHRKVSARAQ